MEDEQAAIDAILKFAVFALIIGAVVGLGTFFFVRVAGINDGGGGNASAGASSTPSSLPSVALSDPGSPSDSPSVSSPTTKAPTGITLSASPVKVGPGQRINLTGTFPGRDNLALQVQRKENGNWTNFADVQAKVRVGTFTTYVLTSRTGDSIFRVFDPTSQKGSNPVTIAVG